MGGDRKGDILFRRVEGRAKLTIAKLILVILPPLQVLGMLLRSKSHLINSNILHLTYTLVGTVDSEQESACIPNLIAFQDLLAGK